MIIDDVWKINEPFVHPKALEDLQEERTLLEDTGGVPA